MNWFCDKMLVSEMIVEEKSMGTWTAKVNCIGTQTLPKQVSIYDETKEFVYNGYVFSQALDSGNTQAFILGGRGNHDLEKKPRFYKSAGLKQIFGDMTREWGETVDYDGIPFSRLDYYTRPKGTLVQNISLFCNVFKLNWRIRRDGTYFLGSKVGTSVDLGDIPLVDSSEVVRVYASEFPHVEPFDIVSGETVYSTKFELLRGSARMTLVTRP